MTWLFTDVFKGQRYWATRKEVLNCTVDIWGIRNVLRDCADFITSMVQANMDKYPVQYRNKNFFTALTIVLDEYIYFSENGMQTFIHEHLPSFKFWLTPEILTVLHTVDSDSGTFILFQICVATIHLLRTVQTIKLPDHFKKNFWDPVDFVMTSICIKIFIFLKNRVCDIKTEITYLVELDCYFTD